MARINPYLNFEGNTEEAFTFYKSVFGGEFSTLMRFKDIPADTAAPGMDENSVMHVALAIGNGSMLMGSDRPASFGPVTKGDNFYIALQTDSVEDAEKKFQSLSSGGKIIMPLEKAFWGDLFGMLTDKFGVQWMVNYDFSKAS